MLILASFIGGGIWLATQFFSSTDDVLSVDYTEELIELNNGDFDEELFELEDILIDDFTFGQAFTDNREEFLETLEYYQKVFLEITQEMNNNPNNRISIQRLEKILNIPISTNEWHSYFPLYKNEENWTFIEISTFVDETNTDSVIILSLSYSSFRLEPLPTSIRVEEIIEYGNLENYRGLEISYFEELFEKQGSVRTVSFGETHYWWDFEEVTVVIQVSGDEIIFIHVISHI